MSTGHIMGHFFDQALGRNGNTALINLVADSVKVALSTNPPVQSSWLTYSDITGEVIGSTGYVTGGTALSSNAIMYYDANKPATAHPGTATAESTGTVVRGDNNATQYIFKCTTSGTTSGSTITWNTALYSTTTDGTVTWTCIGQWATQRATANNSTVFAANDIIADTSGNLYRCGVAGTSGSGVPTFNNTYIGQATTDSGVTWIFVGFAQFQFTANTVSWASSTITASYAYVYDATDALKPLLGYVDFSGSQSSNNGTFSLNWDSHGIFTLTLS